MLGYCKLKKWEQVDAFSIMGHFINPLFSQRRWLFSGVMAWREAFAWARLHGVVDGMVWTHGVIALFSAIGSGLGGLRFLGRDAQAAFRSMA